MSEFDFFDFYAVPLLFVASVVVVSFAILFGLAKLSWRSAPSPRTLAIVDLASFLIGGASIIGFVVNLAVVEKATARKALSDGITINFDDPYDPNKIMAEIRSSIGAICPDEPACEEVLREYEDSRGFKGLPTIKEFITGNDAPQEIKDLIAKFNYGMKHALRPAFFNGEQGLFSLILLSLLAVAYSLGLWRRYKVVRALL
jgi:hypothetical protein